MKFACHFAGLALILVGCCAAAQAATTRLTVYTALENEQLGPYKKAFEADNPDIELRWVRDSNGIITAKLLAERDNPQADMVWGVVATSLLLLEDQAMLLPYAPQGIERLKPNFRDSAQPPAWAGMDSWMAAICFNSEEAARKKLPRPTSWADLAKPIYKGQIVMPNPASSGTGYLAVAGWLQIMGETAGWAFQDRLHENIAAYVHSGSKPCKMAAAGEFPIAISMDYAGVVQRNEGAPIEVIFPSEGSGWDIEATAILKGVKNIEAAKRLADWAVSKKANELYMRYYAVAALPGIAAKLPNYPADAEQHMSAKVDPLWAARHRDPILAEWVKRYQGKSESK
jgi:iron(III) transport system substrate-binding protein